MNYNDIRKYLKELFGLFMSILIISTNYIITNYIIIKQLSTLTFRSGLFIYIFAKRFQTHIISWNTHGRSIKNIFSLVKANIWGCVFNFSIIKTLFFL